MLLSLHTEELCGPAFRQAHAILALLPSVACGFLVTMARLAQSAERKALNLVVVGSSPTVSVA